MNNLRGSLLLTAAAIAWAGGAQAQSQIYNFNFPRQSLAQALSGFAQMSGQQIIFTEDVVDDLQAPPLRGAYTVDAALGTILKGSHLIAERTPSGALMIERVKPVMQTIKLTQTAQAATPKAAAAGVESVVVTSSKIKGDIQTVPIAITALSQEQLTQRQIAGGPDLVKEVPNLTFSKTNFSGYTIQIRGIGTQAISVTTDPAVAVAFNDTPFIRNHFFEQEFFDVSQVEVVRGPQGTLYGRNATAGVVNVVSAKPTDQFEAMLSTDWGNFSNRRYEGMVNIPIVGDKLDLRVAGEWTKRDGYSFNQTTDRQIDGRDLWSSRVTLRWKPVESVTADFIWEHFQESDDRLRSGKQLCKTDFGPGASNLTDTGKLTDANGNVVTVAAAQGSVFGLTTAYFSQGCLPTSMYSPDAFQVPNGFSLPFITGAAYLGFINSTIDPYSQTAQSTNLRNIQSAIEPRYSARNDTLEFNGSWNVTPELTLYSDTGYNNDFLWSTEDYNRFDTSPGIFIPDGAPRFEIDPTTKVFCDPQLGCSDRLVVQDLNSEHAWQLSQEFRLASNFSGPFNFSIGGNYLHYETEEHYYVFSNTFTMIALNNVGCGDVYSSGITDNLYCQQNGRSYNTSSFYANHGLGSIPTESPQYIDPNPITRLDDNGHNYFVSQNPYVLNSYAGFGEAYYNVTPDLKLTAGLRWTDDEKHFTEIPSELLVTGYGYPGIGVTDQKWNEWTGRFVANWSPKLAFTDQSMFYASYAHGYKAGGANPPGAVLLNADTSCGFTNAGCSIQVNSNFPVHPPTFKPEFIDAYELGTKNTLLDGGLTLNGNVFFYNYTGYQISRIVDRTAINDNFNATVRGAEIEATYEPLPGLKFAFAGGYEDTRIKNGQYSIDLMDRTAGTPGWVVMKPSVGQSSNCIFPEYVAAALVEQYGSGGGQGNLGPSSCGMAYIGGIDPVTSNFYNPNTTSFHSGSDGNTYAYPGYDPLSVDPNAPAVVNQGLGLPPNNGEGFAKAVGGNSLPNAPHFTTSFTTDYTIPVSANWAATLHGDFYWQSQSWARVFNDRPYDKIRGYSNVNLALILTDASGWQVMGYVKNIFDTTAITGDFLNSDDSGLTTNIFLTDPRLYGVRITKNFEASDSGVNLFSNSDADDKQPQLWLQLGGNYAVLKDDQQPYAPAFNSLMAAGLPKPTDLQKAPDAGFDWESKLSFQPQGSDWVLKAGIRYGRSTRGRNFHKSLPPHTRTHITIFGNGYNCTQFAIGSRFRCTAALENEFIDSLGSSSEKHAILDFTLGKDVGIGIFGGTSTISGGVRMAQFESSMTKEINADPHVNFPIAFFFGQYSDVYDAKIAEKRNFHGIGPEIAWDGSRPLLGTPENGQVTFDFGLNAAVLFGRQKVNLSHHSSHCHRNEIANGTLGTCVLISSDTHNSTIPRSRNVTVPNLGGYAGLSVRYNDAKISFGYRADEFFGAMDGGQDTAKKYNRGFNGPYLNLSVGFGG